MYIMEWIECTVCEIFAFKQYYDFEIGVRGHSRSSKVALFDRAHTTLYSSSLANMPLSITVSEINNVICYFSKCDPFVKLKLLRYYSSDLYGSVLWDLSHNAVENVCIAWRKGLRRSLELPFCTHSRCVWFPTPKR